MNQQIEGRLYYQRVLMRVDEVQNAFKQNRNFLFMDIQQKYLVGYFQRTAWQLKHFWVIVTSYFLDKIPVCLEFEKGG